MGTSPAESLYPNQRASHHTLVYFDVHRKEVVSVDTSSCRIGSVLLQLCERDLKLVAYCSRQLSDAEKIEKEFLLSVWPCERFKMYLYGQPAFTLITDLIPLMNWRPGQCTNPLPETPRVAYVVQPGGWVCNRETLALTDAMSRSPQRETEQSVERHRDVDCCCGECAETAADKQLQEVIRFRGGLNT